MKGPPDRSSAAPFSAPAIYCPAADAFFHYFGSARLFLPHAFANEVIISCSSVKE
jgi:hypothetical protein